MNGWHGWRASTYRFVMYEWVGWIQRFIAESAVHRLLLLCTNDRLQIVHLKCRWSVVGSLGEGATLRCPSHQYDDFYTRTSVNTCRKKRERN